MTRMCGNSPGRRGAPARVRSGLVLGMLLWSACATQAGPPPKAAPDPELERMRVELAERGRRIRELEGRLALLEAARRSAAEDAAPAPEPARDSVRIGSARAPAEEPEPPETVSHGPRPLLRLHEDGRAWTSNWSPPSDQPRLKVAPVPRLPVSAVAPPSDPAQDLYVHALDLVRRREFPEALRELDAFLQSFPNDGRAVRAAFWRGEVLFAQREYGRALDAFEDVLARDPEGEKAPDVLLRIARCHARLGAPERARAVLAQLTAQFPESDAARLVRQGKQEDT